MAKLTKTMQTLLNRRGGGDSVVIEGAREASAARALVAAGLAKSYDSQSRMFSGQSYYSHFRRGWVTAKPYVSIGGVLHFA
ncbi:hypothetical protein BLA23254_06867 [Burkholderia lata]|uniref:Uncharacterized protein n=1 Tax=Burkholderia lata (strain ATCC 17760 / DSM 23089 / LMG 22485 / NCIMB 9086 / R18194 / 383) TaxID=482957 RepID=A0A6P2RTM0_BURL3|nr:hypothetical protein [Burkholderia lata]VWC39646.1 hypothetical protein BLA23254_06867 [Burkholderia lata]